jgi:hypothetical protein
MRPGEIILGESNNHMIYRHTTLFKRPLSIYASLALKFWCSMHN